MLTAWLLQVQYAVDLTSRWHDGYVPAMHTCDASRCTKQGSTVTIHTKAPSNNYA